MRFSNPHSDSWAHYNEQLLKVQAGKRQQRQLPNPSGVCKEATSGKHRIGHFGPGGSREICVECSVRFDS